MTASSPPGDRYEMVVGLEVHVQLATATKIFCRCSTRFGGAPNANTCPVCLGLPGALPVINQHAVGLAVRAAQALDCTVRPSSAFARKNYFYPDLPKGYQISQFDQPLAVGGCVTIGTRPDGSPVVVNLTRVHLEEDAGKSIHDRYPGATAVDLNRAGVPLIEIVSEPDIRGSAEAEAYLTVLKRILEYVAVSDVSMERGSLRVDANVSARIRGESALGTKTEIKNLNSFSGVVRALEAEFARQCAVLDAGGRVEQQTMIWDSASGRVSPARSKEASHDYRYFPDPDLPPLVLHLEWIDEIKRAMPELPEARRERYRTEYAMIGASIVERLVASRAVGDYFEQVARQSADPKAAANWLTTEVPAALNASSSSLDQLAVRPADLAQLITLVNSGVVSHTAAKQIFATMVATGDPPRRVAERDGLLKVSDDDRLAAWIDEVLAASPEEAARYLGGEQRLQGVLVGQVMKRSNGSADPKRVNQLLAARIGR
ncbi:MAG TPA: Asp-tRNA(Asn)/Glu-tRNA(Gln) amidotransferase subunit GatB [Gemmatimonadaceae bacterium]|nr:Asp-tRNA(Asn)/Glu-tRNA(Gln) amidotransferase subunit GatB [Gemmatimonadaceae bacterium]